MPESFETRVASAKRSIRERSYDGVQRRSVPALLEMRAKDSGIYEVRGHAAVFGLLSENLGGFRERIEPGAFEEVLKSRPDVRALFNHDPNLVLARTTNGTLSLREDETGLVYEAEIAPTSYGNDLRVLLERGDVTQSSFAFRIAAGGDEWHEDEETGGLIRTITNFSALYDVSPVTYPAYPDTDVAPRTSQTEGERSVSADAQEQDKEMAPSDTERAEDTTAWRTRARERQLRLLSRF